jgi:hypothetical protein
LAESEAATRAALEDVVKPPPEQFLIVVECRDEEDQVELLQKLEAQGITCRALVS